MSSFWSKKEKKMFIPRCSGLVDGEWVGKSANNTREGGQMWPEWNAEPRRGRSHDEKTISTIEKNPAGF
jgi:hypothetical protein